MKEIIDFLFSDNVYLLTLTYILLCVVWAMYLISVPTTKNWHWIAACTVFFPFAAIYLLCALLDWLFSSLWKWLSEDC